MLDATRTSLASLLALALLVTACAGKPATQQSDTRPGPTPSIAGPQSSTPPRPPAPPDTLAAALDRVNRYITAAEQAQAKIPLSDFDVTAKAAQIGNDLDKLFAFVRDEIHYEAYRGVLRGPSGTLMNLAGNAADKSLLLAALLHQHKHQVRLVHGVLAVEKAQELVAQLLRAPAPPPNDTEKRLGEIRDILRRAATTGDEQRFLDDTVQWTHASGRTLEARTEQDSRFLRGKLSAAGVKLGGEQAQQAELLASARDHFWLQVNRDGQWVDLDPSFVAARLGQRFTESDQTLAWDSLQQNITHLVTFRVTVEYLSGTSFINEEVLRVTLPSHELVGAGISFANVPLGEIADYQALQKATAFVPTLQVASQQYRGTEFALAGQPTTSSGPVSGFPGGLTGSGAPGGDRVLSAQWLDIESASPGEKPRSHRREILDRIGSERRALGKAPDLNALAPPAHAAITLVGKWDILVGPALYNGTFVLYRILETLLRNREVIAAAVSTRYGQEVDDAARKALAGASLYPLELLNLFNAMSLFVSEENTQARGRARWYVPHPLLFIFKQAFALPRDGANTDLTLVAGYDIIDHGLRIVHQDTSRQVDDQLRLGVLLTNLERLLVSQIDHIRFGAMPRLLNASTIVELAQQQGVETVVLTGSSSALVERLQISQRAKARIQDELANGFAVVVPTRSVRVGSDSATAWWRISPDGGHTLGIGEDGEGQASVEYRKALRVVAAALCIGLNAYKSHRKEREGKQAAARAHAVLMWVCLIGGGASFYGVTASAGAKVVLDTIAVAAGLVNGITAFL